MKLELFRKELPPSARIRSLLAYDLHLGSFGTAAAASAAYAAAAQKYFGVFGRRS